MKPSDEVRSLARKEMLHGYWHLIAEDAEYKKARSEGFEYSGWLQVPRRFFPWVILFGADWLEK